MEAMCTRTLQEPPLRQQRMIIVFGLCSHVKISMNLEITECSPLVATVIMTSVPKTQKIS
jgi:hypothetical protein